MATLLRGSAVACLFMAATSGFAGANAADVMEEPAPHYSWSGFYMGAYAGAGALIARSDLEIPADLDFEFEDGDDGFVFGGLLGFNWQAGERFVLGLQGDIALPDMEVANSQIAFTIGPDFIASASLRAGFLVTPDTLLYAIGGYSYAEFDVDDVDDLAGVDQSSIADDSFDGFHVGTGMETRLTPRLSARIEYRYTDFGNSLLLESIEQLDNATLDMRLHTHTATLGLAYTLFPVLGESVVTSPAADIVEPTVSWTGLYIGISGGAGALLMDTENLAGDGFTFGGEGFIGSLMAGYNWQAGEKFVIGLEGAVGLSDVNWDHGFNGANLVIEDFTAELDWFASASLRAGWLVSPETMIYVLGGYSYAEIELDGEVSVLDVPVADKDSDGFDGFHVGAGIEAMLTDSLTARVEYRYTDYTSGKLEIFEDAEGLSSANLDSPATHAGTVGLAWLFN